jgi:hypothetical protein
LCFIDPNYLFDAKGYETNGMILFKDYVNCTNFINSDFLETIGIGVQRYCDYTGDFEIDSSCVVVDKKKYWETLFTICIVNVKSDSYHKSKNVLGDKDTWLLSAMFMDLNPFISEPSPKVMVTDENKVVVGHLQSTIFDGVEVFTHYNNQQILVKDVNVNDYNYAEVKNPRAGQEQNYSFPLTEKITKTFEYAKEAMIILDPYIPSSLKEKVKSTNGITNGLIP